MSPRLTKEQLNKQLLCDLGDRVESYSDISGKPLLVNLKSPKRKLKIYVFNCTCPPGGRALDEYKVQLIIEGQKRGERGRFEDSDGRDILIIGYARPYSNDGGVYVIWDTNYHKEFAYSANLQCYLDPMLDALNEEVVTCFKKGNQEKIVVCLHQHIAKAVERRLDLNLLYLLEQ